MEKSEEGWEWDEKKLEMYFEVHICQQIIRTKIHKGKKDELRWKLKKSGKFTIKSMYKKIMLRGQPENNQLKQFWSKIWRMNTIPRVITFIWKCIHSILPLNERVERVLPYIN